MMRHARKKKTRETTVKYLRKALLLLMEVWGQQFLKIDIGVPTKARVKRVGIINFYFTIAG